MTRKEFVRICGILGIGFPLTSSFTSCSDSNVLPPTFEGNVIIIGAGAGGLSSGYLLQQQGIAFEILEASSSYGGRMKIDRDFADFPIPLGAEWLETGAGIFQEIVNDPSVAVNINTFPDDPDLKFVNSSWFNFYETYVVPSVSDQIRYNTIVQSIDYSGDQIIVNTQQGQKRADKVIISIPLKMLQLGKITFLPPLPADKQEAIQTAPIWDGFKAFFEFSQNFYGDEEQVVSDNRDGQKLYYNAALGQNTHKNILGLFTVGKPARDFINLSENDLKGFILQELDSLYNNLATPHYIRHISQNWNNEAFIQGGYLSDFAEWRKVRELGNPVRDKLYFAGGAYTDGEDWVSVHTAAQSAKRAVEGILN
ncbi:MAG: FAD-dependent oxidoreductase [Bacteroidota bacterium]